MNWLPRVNAGSRVIPPGAALGRASALERPLVFTNGVFDILHRGHVTYLAQASLGAECSGD